MSLECEWRSRGRVSAERAARSGRSGIHFSTLINSVEGRSGSSGTSKAMDSTISPASLRLTSPCNRNAKADASRAACGQSAFSQCRSGQIADQHPVTDEAHCGHRLAGPPRAWFYQRTSGQEIGLAGAVVSVGRRACVCDQDLVRLWVDALSPGTNLPSLFLP
jgi:hypothetical protein